MSNPPPPPPKQSRYQPVSIEEDDRVHLVETRPWPSPEWTKKETLCGKPIEALYSSGEKVTCTKCAKKVPSTIDCDFS